MGDFNLHYDSPRNADVQQVCTFLSDRGVIQLVRDPTHRRGHILDWLVDPDDTQLFKPAPPADFDFVSKQTERCVDRVRVWMKSNKLKLNEEKAEAMVVGSRSRTSVSGTGHLEIGNSLISFQPNVKDLGVVLD